MQSFFYIFLLICQLASQAQAGSCLLEKKRSCFLKNKRPSKPLTDCIIKLHANATKKLQALHFNPHDRKEVVKNLFISQGYWDCKFVQKDANILELIPGKKSFIKDLKINVGVIAKKFPLPFISKKALSNAFMLQEYKNQVLQTYKSHGYLQTQGTWEIKTIDEDREKKYIALELNINAGKKFKFGPIEFSGTSRIPQEQLQQLLVFNENDAWDPNKIKKSKRKLENIGLFKRVQINAQATNRFEHNKLPIEVFLQDHEKHQFNFKFGLTYCGSARHIFERPLDHNIKNKFDFNFDNTVTCRNLISSLETIELQTCLNSSQQSINLSHIKPYSNQIFTGIGRANLLFNHEKIYPQARLPDDNALSMLHFAAQAGVTKDYAAARQIFGCLGLQAIKPRALTAVNWSIHATAEIEASMDRLFGPWNHRSGFCGSLSYKIFHPLNPQEKILSRWQVDCLHLMPLPFRSSLAMRMCWQKLNRHTQESSVEQSLIEQLLQPYSLDNVEPDMFCQPTDSLQLPSKYNSELVQLYRSKNYTLLKTDFELRVLLSSNLAASIFYNVCLNFPGKHDLFTGVGLRYNTPLATVYFDMGWHKKNESIRWRLTLGETI